MKSLTVTIRRIGNSQGIDIPKPLLAQVGLEGEAEMTVEDGHWYCASRHHRPTPAGFDSSRVLLATLATLREVFSD